MTYLIQYLSEFELIFETVLGYVSGDRMGYFEAKKTESKISCLGTFKAHSAATINAKNASFHKQIFKRKERDVIK